MVTAGPPSNLQATAISSMQTRLDWNDNSANETGFHIYEGTLWQPSYE
jgi:hypothetical protein